MTTTTNFAATAAGMVAISDTVITLVVAIGGTAIAIMVAIWDTVAIIVGGTKPRYMAGV